MSFSAHAWTTTTDSDYWQENYSGGTDIDFSRLKDGTTYGDTDKSDLIRKITHRGNTIEYEVWNNAWADDLLISFWNGSGFQQVVRWDGDSIRGNDPKHYKRMFFMETGEDNSAIALEIESDTYSGFLGLIPDTPEEKSTWIIYPNLVVTDLKYKQTGFGWVTFQGDYAFVQGEYSRW